MKILDFDYIKSLNIPGEELYNWCNEVWQIKEKCILPAKVKMWQGKSGRYITMPCVIPDLDIAGVKFIARNVDDINGIPARNSHILLQPCSRMGLLAIVDGMWITNMRTGAIAAHSVVEYCKSTTETLGLMGLGLVARAFMVFLGLKYKKPLRIKLLRHKDQAESFIERFQADYPQFSFEIVDSYDEICSSDVVVSAVGYARNEFAEDSVFKPGCLVVPIQTSGFQNCDLFFDKVIIDDDEHVKSYKYYEQFKERTVEVSKIEQGIASGRENDLQRIVAYCGGIALHDLYLANKIYEIACTRNDAPEFEMKYPEERLWI